LIRADCKIATLSLAALLIVLCARPTFALSSERTLAQYVHTVWGPDQGYPGGTIYAIAQSKDGYLWLGTDRGLVRFDGFNFTSISTFPTDHRRIGAVRGLVEGADGSLWVRLDGPRVLEYRDGAFIDATSQFGLSDVSFTAASRDTTGDFLLWGPRNRLLRFRDGQFRPIFPPERNGGIVVSVVESPGGIFWLGTRDAGLYRVEKGNFAKVLSDAELHGVNALAPSDGGGVWIGSESGLYLWEHGASINLGLPDRLRKAQVLALVRDHNHNLWVGTDNGLYRIDSRLRVVTGFYRNRDDPGVSAIFEDPDGDIWFGGSKEIERSRDGMFASYSQRETSLKEIGGPIFVDDSGRAWFGPTSGGLFYLENGITRRVAVPGLNDDVIYSIDGTKDGTRDELWLGRQRGGLTELTRHGPEWQARTYTQKDGLPQDSVFTVTVARDGSVWAGTVSSGVAVLRHGNFESYTLANGLQSNAIFSSLETADGKMWFASPSGLLCFDGQHWTVYTAKDTRTEPLNIRTAFEDSGHLLWIGTSRGLARLSQGEIDLLSDLPPALEEEVLGIGQDKLGFLWIVTTQQVLRVDRSKLLSGSLGKDDVQSYGADDGLTETDGVRRDRSLVSDSAGRIWLSLPHSLAVADVGMADAYRMPVRVRIDSVVIDGETPVLGRSADLPSTTRNIAFRCSGTSLSMPQRTHLRYFMAGAAHTWSNAASQREIVYSNLSPGKYTFRIMASNALGLWNGPESDFSFTIEPAFWQTWWFRLLSLALLLGALWAAYAFRVRHLTTLLQIRHQERLLEREEIARDLHDTFFQAVQSLFLRLHTASRRLPEDSPTRRALDEVLDDSDQVMSEGRETFLDAPGKVPKERDFEKVVAGYCAEFAAAYPIEYRVQADGQARSLNPLVAEEFCKIAREAIYNAFRHSKATVIEVEITYGRSEMQFRVRDNGQGFEPALLHGDAPRSHLGLKNMSRRAEKLGAEFQLWSRLGGGTELEVTLSAQRAYISTGKKWAFLSSWRGR